jgi:hypothetical protein
LQMIFNAGKNALLHPGALQEFPDAAFTRQKSSGSPLAVAGVRSTPL